MTKTALFNHPPVNVNHTVHCSLYPAPVTEEPTTPIAKGQVEREIIKRKPNDGKSIEAWLLKQRMSNDNLYRQQQVHDSDIIRLECKMRKVESRMALLEGAVVALMAICGGLLACLI